MKKVFVTGKIMAAGLNMLKEFADVEIIENPLPGVVTTKLEGADGILHKVGNLPAGVLRKNKDLKIIARHGVGLDDIDLSYVQQNNIWLTTTGDANTNAVAEFIIGLIFAITRNIVKAHNKLALEKRWIRESLMGEELYGKTLGIVGYGRIGKRVAKLAQGCGFQVKACDPYANNVDVQLLPLKDVARQADFLSINCPLTDETKGLINSEVFSAMKPSAFIINTARGALVEEEALIEALEKEMIRGAALDVFTIEPLDMRNRLLDLDNVIVTPHIAAMTRQAQEKMAIMAAEEIRRVLLEGIEPVYPLWQVDKTHYNQGD